MTSAPLPHSGADCRLVGVGAQRAQLLELRGDPRQVVAQQLLALRRAVREALVLGAEPLVRPLGRVAPLGRVERRARAFEPRYCSSFCPCRDVWRTYS